MSSLAFFPELFSLLLLFTVINSSLPPVRKMYFILVASLGLELNHLVIHSLTINWSSTSFILHMPHFGCNDFILRCQGLSLCLFITCHRDNFVTTTCCLGHQNMLMTLLGGSLLFKYPTQIYLLKSVLLFVHQSFELNKLYHTPSNTHSFIVGCKNYPRLKWVLQDCVFFFKVFYYLWT